MSVLDSIDTTVTLEWPGRRTIGTLAEIDGYTATITALNGPVDGASLTVTVEGDTADEAIAIDGVCLAVTETAWGEQRIEMELMRVGTTCSASRLRDFVEEYGVASGGSVHIGASRTQPGKRRFVYHVPERGGQTGEAASARPLHDDDMPRLPEDVDALFPATEPSHPSTGGTKERRRSNVETAHNFGRPVVSNARTGETLRAENSGFTVGADGELDALMGTLSTEFGAAPFSGRLGGGVVGGDPDDGVGFDEDDMEEMGIGTMPDKTINSDLAAGAFVTGGSLDEAFREALRAVDRPKMPEIEPEVVLRRSQLVQSSPDVGLDVVPLDAELGRPVLPLDDLEPTRMMEAIVDDDEVQGGIGSGNFSETDLSLDEVSRLKAAIDDAIAHERDVADSERHDPNEPIIVNTVHRSIPFAEPIQLGNDNRAPSMAQVAPVPTATKPKPEQEAEPALPDAKPTPATTQQSRTSTARIERVAPSLAGVLIAPKARKSSAPKLRTASGSLERIQNLFNVDMAIRCELPAIFQIGKKKYQGQLIRLAESRLRVQSAEKHPHLYQRMKVYLDPVGGGKGKIVLQCEVTRIRDSQDDSGVVAFDVRLSAGTNSPKEMNALRALMQSFEAPSARPAEASA